jgi:hypothetical protein
VRTRRWDRDYALASTKLKQAAASNQCQQQ